MVCIDYQNWRQMRPLAPGSRIYKIEILLFNMTPGRKPLLDWKRNNRRPFRNVATYCFGVYAVECRVVQT
jgi:hypothetical protein